MGFNVLTLTFKIFGVQGRSTSSMLVPPESSSASLCLSAAVLVLDYIVDSSCYSKSCVCTATQWLRTFPPWAWLPWQRLSVCLSGRQIMRRQLKRKRPQIDCYIHCWNKLDFGGKGGMFYFIFLGLLCYAILLAVVWMPLKSPLSWVDSTHGYYSTNCHSNEFCRIKQTWVWMEKWVTQLWKWRFWSYYISFHSQTTELRVTL